MVSFRIQNKRDHQRLMLLAPGGGRSSPRSRHFPKTPGTSRPAACAHAPGWGAGSCRRWAHWAAGVGCWCPSPLADRHRECRPAARSTSASRGRAPGWGSPTSGRSLEEGIYDKEIGEIEHMISISIYASRYDKGCQIEIDV